MKKFFLYLAMFLCCAIGYAQDNIEKTDSYPTGYIKAAYPYYYDTIDGVLYVFSGSSPHILVRFPVDDSRQTYTIPKYVTRIARGAFRGCKNLKELIIPTTVMYIGEDAFDDSGITSFTVSDKQSGAVSPSPDASKGTEGIQYFDLSGKALANPTPGVNILVNNGSATKVLVK